MQQFDIQNTTLGKVVSTPDKYDASLLFSIPRQENRLHYDIEASNLPFLGFDVWNCYEFSFLTNNGLPVSRVLKLIYASDSEFLVESKSLKIYLNAFNMDTFGETIAEAEKRVVQIISNDLNKLLKTEVKVLIFDAESLVEIAFPKFENAELSNMIPSKELESIIFTHFNESPELIKSQVTGIQNHYRFRSDLLRSNCRVTNQPDWGDLYVEITTLHLIDFTSIMQYLVSFRKENHFHEEVVEMIYKRFYDKFNPKELMVAAMYTRRGGIDINPIRASNIQLLDEVLISSNCRVAKTIRQ